MSPSSSMRRFVQATVLCWRTLREERRDPLPLAALAIILVIIGDDVVMWLAGMISPGWQQAMSGWGATLLTLLFGIVPAAALVGLALGPVWLAAWNRAGKDFDSR